MLTKFESMKGVKIKSVSVTAERKNVSHLLHEHSLTLTRVCKADCVKIQSILIGRCSRHHHVVGQ